MLPPRLQEIKENLEAKRYGERKIAEDQLLAELKALDQSPELRDILAGRRDIMKMTSGPAGHCACCGR